MLPADTQTNDAVVEAMPASVLYASRRNGIVLIALITFSGFAIHLSTLPWSDGQLDLRGLLTIWLCLALSGLLVVSLMHRTLKTRAPTVKLESGVLAVHYGKYTLQANLKDCHVRQGRAGGMRLAGGVVLWSWLPVILIDLPPFWIARLGLRNHPRRINTVAVGYTTETREAWERSLLQRMNPDTR